MKPTNWYVITGAPCSGKTAVIFELKHRGFQVVHEVARAFVDAELKKGKHMDEIKVDVSAFEGDILNKKIEIECSLKRDAVIFLDRAIPDSIAYYQLTGLDTNKPIQKSKIFLYKKIFLFDRFEFENDPVRSEDDVKAQRLEMLLGKSYRNLGYDIVRVPHFSIKERADFILQYLE